MAAPPARVRQGWPPPASAVLPVMTKVVEKVTLLIIDDFGLRPLRSPQDEDFHHLVSERYERATTIVTSNLDFSEWSNAFPNQLLAALDRPRHNAHRIILEGASFRGRSDASAINKKEKKLKVESV